MRKEQVLVDRSRYLRTNMTDAEKLLWRHLRLRQIDRHKFRRQYVFDSFILDFVCLEAKLVIEVDGGQHAEQTTYDEERLLRLQQNGFTVLRFWNNEVLMNIEGVKEKIWGTLQELSLSHSSYPHPNLPPSRGKE